MRSPRAFTMIELLAALALASVLMLAVMEVTAGLGAASDAVARRGGAAAWPTHLYALIEQDLRQSLNMQVDEGALRFSGPLGIDPQSLARTHRPVIVRYELRDAAGLGLLVRVQQDLLDRTNRPADTFLLAHGVRAWKPALTQAKPERGGAPLPRLYLDLTAEFRDPEQPALRLRMEVR